MEQNVHLTMEHQLQLNWCWAATAVSIANFLKPPCAFTQCTLACELLNCATCCSDGITPQCDQQFSPGDALRKVGHYARTQDDQPPFELVIRELSALRPLSVFVSWNNDSGGHNFALTGYDDDDPARPLVDIDDPLFGPTTQQDFNAITSTYHGGYNGGFDWVSTILTT